MPLIDGREAPAKIKSAPQPILILTTFGEARDIEFSKHLGVAAGAYSAKVLTAEVFAVSSRIIYVLQRHIPLDPQTSQA
jgi:CheY-like chemotaxis protein